MKENDREELKNAGTNCRTNNMTVINMTNGLIS